MSVDAGFIDSGVPTCGDNHCSSNETCSACEVDCGPCPTCGDGQCNGAETCGSCEADCGACNWPPELAQGEDEIVALLNQFRAQGANCGGAEMPPVGPVRMNNELRTAARLHSQDMADQNYFDHTSQDGRSPWDRVAEAMYRGQPVGENIAAGNSSAEATFQQWVNSPGHCRNMMNGQANEVGVGHGYNRNAQYGHYWTQVFGRR